MLSISVLGETAAARRPSAQVSQLSLTNTGFGHKSCVTEDNGIDKSHNKARELVKNYIYLISRTGIFYLLFYVPLPPSIFHWLLIVVDLDFGVVQNYLGNFMAREQREMRWGWWWWSCLGNKVGIAVELFWFWFGEHHSGGGEEVDKDIINEESLPPL